MGKDIVTIDVDLKNITREMVDNIELAANQAIYDNVDIQTAIVNTKEEAEKYPVRKAITLEKDIRIVHILGIDCVACCGTHPVKSGEVGIIKIYKVEKNKGMTRIYFQCGMRALKTFQNKNRILTALNQKYSSEDNTLLEKLDNEEKKFKETKSELINLKENINLQEANTLCDKHEKSPIINTSYNDKTIDDLKSIAKKIIENTDAVILLASTKDKAVLLSHSGSNELNCGKLFKESINSFNGRGGGAAKFAQGVFQTEDDLSGFYGELRNKIIDMNN